MTDRTPAQAMSDLIAKLGPLPVAKLNEAATRLLIINTILSDVLGWPVENFNPEELVAAWSPVDDKKREWLDYHLRSGDVIQLVVEAKRAGTMFTLPATRKDRKLPLKQLSDNHGKALAQAISQARTYSLGVGTQSFAVTNGHQWITSILFAQNIRAESLQAVVFYDLEDIRLNLQEFIDYLSPDGIASQSLMTSAVSGRSLQPRFARSINEEVRPGKAFERNYLISPMKVLMATCFRDLTSEDHAEMLDECYVSSDATDEHLKRLESFAGIALPHSLEYSKRIDRNENDALDELQRARGDSLLVIGRAGSGKSTFLAVTRKRLMTKPGTHLVLHVDLEYRTQTHATKFDHDRLVDEVCADILTQAEKLYPLNNPFANELLREVFSGEIKRLRTSLSPVLRDTPEAELRIDALIQQHLKSPLSHLKAYLGYLDKGGLAAIILLDNVDRGTPEFEKVVFQLGQSLTQNTNATVVTSLRETTYQSGRTQGFLDVGRHNVLAIGPPPFVEVAERRFNYTRTRLTTDRRLFQRFARALGGIPAERVFDFAEIISEMVLGESRGIQACIQALAGTNIRVALELLEAFATSPTTDLDKLFREYRHGEQNRHHDVGPTLDAFLRSVMRDKDLRYREEKSRIVNLFQASKTQIVSHFTAIRILQLLVWKSHQTYDSRNFESTDLSVRDVIAQLGSLGYTGSSVTSFLSRLGKHGLVNSLSKPEPPWSPTDTVRLGSAGRYYLEELIFNREYIKSLVDDVIYYEEPVLRSLEHFDRDSVRPWRERAEDKARGMLIYLARREHDELSRIGAQTARPEWLRPVAQQIGTQFFGRSFLQDISSGNRPSQTKRKRR